MHTCIRHITVLHRCDKNFLHNTVIVYLLLSPACWNADAEDAGTKLHHATIGKYDYRIAIL